MTVPRPRIIDRIGSVQTHGDQDPQRIVWHDTESSDAKGIREANGIIDAWRRQGRGYGAHFIVDAAGNIVQTAAGKHRLYAVTNHNTGSIHIEIVGYAWWDVRRWRGRKAQLEAVARLTAYLCDYWDIPPVHSYVYGVCRHMDFPGADHHDPGKGFPFAAELERTHALWDAGR